MEIDYKRNKLRKQVSSGSEIKRNFGVHAKGVSQRLDEITSSKTLAVLMKIPAANCHQLHGDREGEWAVDVSRNFRMIFELDHDPVPKKDDNSLATDLITRIRIIEIGDYH